MPATTSTEATTAAAQTTADSNAHSLRYACYVVGVLTLLYAFSFIDRQIFSLLVGPLRRDLHIGDAKMSLLIGFSFALFYTLRNPSRQAGRHLQPQADHRSWPGTVERVHSQLWTGANVRNNAFAAHGRRRGRSSAFPGCLLAGHRLFSSRTAGYGSSVYSMGIYVGSGMAYLSGG